MTAILRQATIRGVPDGAAQYRDYVLGTGQLHAVWQLIDRAYELAGFNLVWSLDSNSVLEWSATYTDSGDIAVLVDPAFVRPADPVAIGADPRRIQRDLGWTPRLGLDVFLEDMLGTATLDAEPSAVRARGS